MTEKERAQWYGRGRGMNTFALFLRKDYRGPNLTWEGLVKHAREWAVRDMWLNTGWSEEKVKKLAHHAEEEAEFIMNHLLSTAGFTPEDYFNAGVDKGEK